MINTAVSALSLFAGAFALSIAIYLQFLGTEAPVSYAIGFYVLGSGIMLILYEMAISYSTSIVIVGVLLILASEFITAWTVVKSYNIRSPQHYIAEILNGADPK